MKSATIYTIKTKEPIHTVIESTTPNIPGPGKVKFSLFITLNGEKTELGFITLYWVRILDDGTYGSEYFPYPLTKTHKFYSYGREESSELKSKILIESLHSHMSDKYCGIGKSLVQKAIEYSYELGCDGRIFAEAVRNSPGFYYKLGLRTSTPKTDEIIRKKLEETPGIRLKKNFGSIMMYMYKDQRTLWSKNVISPN